MSSDPLLEVTDLKVHFGTPQAPLRAVDGISYSLEPGESLAIVGESGSGKSVGVRALLGLQPDGSRIAGGSAVFDGVDLLSCGERTLQRIRGKDISMVFQDALQSLNPTLTLRRQLTEHQLRHRLCGTDEAVERAVAMLGRVGVPEPERRINLYPYQLSGGLRQRAMIAMAMVTRPKLLIADEPTTAVDVTLQRQILDLLAEFSAGGTAVIMITHDLGVARYLCDKVAVMYAGKVVETAPTGQLLDTPRHPYSAGLLGSTVEVGDRDRPLIPIAGTPPRLRELPVGCPFTPRCPHAEAKCRTPQPLIDLGPGRAAACWKAA